MKKLFLLLTFVITIFTISAQSSSFHTKRIITKSDSLFLKNIMTSPLLGDGLSYIKEKIKKQDSIDYAYGMSVSLDTILLFHYHYGKITFTEASNIFLNQAIYHNRIIELREFYGHNFRRYEFDEKYEKKLKEDYEKFLKLPESEKIKYGTKNPLDY